MKLTVLGHVRDSFPETGVSAGELKADLCRSGRIE